MNDVLRWWLAAAALGLIGMPYAFRLLRFLPDRGYTASRALGLVLAVYALWMLSSLGLVPYSRGGVVAVLAALALGALALAGRDRHELAAHLRGHATLIITAEAVFAVAMIGFALLRASYPPIQDTEKPFEFAFFNGVLRDAWMPASDPWYGGEPLSYYYGGYLIVALFTHLCGTAPGVAFNLGIALTAGMTAFGAFGLGANLLLATHGRRRRRLPDRGLTRAAVAGVVSVALLLVVSNLEGVLEFTAAHGWGGTAFYQRLGIQGLPPPTLTKEWYPDSFYAWWHATRFASQLNVLEFPFFSFMLGDLHAHVLVLPISLLGLATLLNVLRSGERLDFEAARRAPVQVLYLGGLAGMLGMVNSWDQPLFVGLLFASALVLNMEREGVTLRAVGHTIAYVIPVGVLSFALYLPFVLDLHPATYGLSLVEINGLPSAGDPEPLRGLPRESMVFPPHHFLLFWGPLLLVGGAGIVAEAVRRRLWRARIELWALAVLLGVTPLLLWSMLLTGSHRSMGAVPDEIAARATAWSFGSYLLVQGVVLALVVVGLAALLTEAGRPRPERRAGRVYITVALTAALVLIHVVELFYVKEPGPGRLNTLFKFSFLAWLLLATAGGPVLMELARALPLRFRGRTALLVWAPVTAVVLVLGLVYPLTMPFNFTNGFSQALTLDGLAALRRQQPDEYSAAVWLNENLTGRPIVLEGIGGDYSAFGRVSARTGLPTLLGWPFHEAQGRGGKNFLEAAWDRLAGALRLQDPPLSGEELYEQQAITGATIQRDVDIIYRTPNADQARALLEQYGVDYVYFGRLESEQYGTEGLDKFDELGHVVYRNGAVIIYQVSTASPPLGHGQ